MRKLSELKLKHEGQDIYVVGSGPSLNYISNKFLEDKIVICVNHTIDYVEGKEVYVVSKEPPRDLQSKTKRKKATLLTCKYQGGDTTKTNEILYPEETVLFKPNRHSELEPFKREECLTTSASTIATALHFAGYLGAKSILLIGHDCGKIDDEIHVKEYNKSNAITSTEHYQIWMNINSVEAYTLKLKRVLEKLWNIPVHSINPFINFGLEGHHYERFKR